MAGVDGGGDVRHAAQAERGPNGRAGGQPAKPAEGSISFTRGESLRCSHKGHAGRRRLTGWLHPGGP